MVRTSPITGLPIEEEGPDLGRPPLWRRLNWKRVTFIVVGLYVSAQYLTSGLGLTEKDRALQAVDRIQVAVEEKNLIQFQSVLSNDYDDRSGLGKRELVALALSYFRGQDDVEIIRTNSSVELDGDRATIEVRVQILGRTGGTLTRGLTDDSMFGEKYTFRLKKEKAKWKIVAIDPERRNWPGR